ncbi:MAG: gliding motility-associated C-terminal domain-containing protein, partial [Bacteroidetes bacterium]|nr:gliding motility-associated C-terminal domain-containing protein [Bacteroidota bacterium]
IDGDGQEFVTEKSTPALYEHEYGEAGLPSNMVYTLEIISTSDEGCVAQKSYQITALATPKADFIAQPEVANILNPLVRFDNRTEEIPNVTEYAWDFGNYSREGIIENGGINTSLDKMPVFRYADTGTYNVRLVAINPYTVSGVNYSCSDTTYREVRINEEIIMYIPTAFTPDDKGLGANNTWKPVTSAKNFYNAKIYNRWGELVWESDDPEAAWDGTFRNEMAEMDAYVYVVTAKSTDGSKDYEFTGTVTLIR